jgi:hypothetical protein
MTNIIEDTLKRAFEHMDPHTGEFPADWGCIRCGVKLNADGGHPAEIYAGTYNGLCYPCTSAGPFIVCISELDGAQDVSWPPHCPSWRRSRETFFGYPDCETCKGAGATRGYGHHTPVWKRCESCSSRYHGHPLRKWYWDRASWLRKAADARFQATLDRVALAKLGTKRASRKRITETIGTLTEDELTAIRTPIIEKYAALEARRRERGESIYATQPVVPTPKQHRLSWTPMTRDNKTGMYYDGRVTEILLEGPLDECRTHWTEFMRGRRMLETDPDRYKAIGYNANQGVVHCVHIINAGSLRLESPDRKDDAWP